METQIRCFTDDKILQLPAWGPKADIPRKHPRKGVMNEIHPKAAHLQLDPRLYESLQQQVPCRDGWRCHLCGVMSSLEVHHKEFRSHAGDDSEENLITVCTACHAFLHRG
jgi:5-methylcytosine-specific restriction endonuclease McrA